MTIPNNIRIVMLVSPTQTFEWDWLNAARQCSEVLALEHSKTGLDWPPLPDFPVLARNPDHSDHYRVLRPKKLPRRLFGPLADFRSVALLTDVLKYLASIHGQIDLVHTHFYAGARFMPDVRRKTGIPYVITEHSSAFTLASPDKSINSRGLRIANRAYKHATTVMPVSHSLEQAIHQRGLSGNFVVVDNPVDTSVFYPDELEKPASREPAFQLVSVGRLAAVKGYDVLLHALRRVVDVVPTVNLRIAGGGPCKTQLLELRAQLELERHVEFLGPQPRNVIAPLLRESDAFVLASRTENLPVVLIEAMASGLPVIATRVGGVPEMVRDDVTGKLVRPNDPDDLADAIRHIIERRHTFDARAIATTASDRYSLNAIGSVLTEIYQSATRSWSDPTAA